MQYSWIVNILYMPTIGFVKLSILFLYIRIFGGSKTLRYICYGQIAIVIAWMISSTMTVITLCLPISATWDVNAAASGAECLDYNMVFVGMNSVDVFLCVSIFLTPIWWIWRLHLPRADVIQVSIALLIGGT